MSEIQKAYFKSHEPEGLNHKIVNGDGSVAIINPVFSYAGKQIPYSTDSFEHYNGVCKYFGFSSSHGYEKIIQEGPLVKAIMKSNGSLENIYHDIYSGGNHTIVKTIVCSSRP